MPGLAKTSKPGISIGLPELKESVSKPRFPGVELKTSELGNPIPTLPLASSRRARGG